MRKPKAFIIGEKMITKISGGTIISDGKKFRADVYIKDGVIEAVTCENLSFDTEIDASGKYVSPGFIDAHIHGAAGYDFLDNTEEAFLKISEECAKHGTTTIIPTVTSSTKQMMIDALNTFEKVKNLKVNGAEMPGIHFEGPYFSPVQKGAQDEKYLRNFDPKEYKEILNMTDSIIRWTGAPELDGSEAFAKSLCEKGILPCIGHSNANSDEVKAAFENGFTHITHLYSCTSTVHRKNAFRYAGIVEAAYLNDEMSVEIIADGIHLPSDLLKLVYKIKGADKTILVTDSMRGAGMPNGESVLGGLKDGLKVIIEDGVAKLPDRTAFAGSVASSDRLVKNMVNMADVPLESAILMITKTPAKIMRLEKKGIIRKGYNADIVIFDDCINIERTIVGGRTVYIND